VKIKSVKKKLLIDTRIGQGVVVGGGFVVG
jgi:hypothetical protein